MGKNTSMQLSWQMRKKLFELKNELGTGTKIPSYEDVIENLLKIKNIIFTIEFEGMKREVNGIILYDKLKQGWKIKGYKLKE